MARTRASARGERRLLSTSFADFTVFPRMRLARGGAQRTPRTLPPPSSLRPLPSGGYCASRPHTERSQTRVRTHTHTHAPPPAPRKAHTHAHGAPARALPLASARRAPKDFANFATLHPLMRRAASTASAASAAAMADFRPPGAEPYDAALQTKLKEALIAMGPNYIPRTHHLVGERAPKYANRLVLETSPYLLQHAHNPVNWFPWSDEAFAEAKRLKRPVFLSSGYSAHPRCDIDV